MTTETKNELLKLNLQHFAEPEGNSDSPEGGDAKGDDKSNEGGDTPSGNSDNKPEGGGEEKRFTQAELEEILKDRLKREKKKAEEKAEQERLEEQGEYKELLEAARADLEAKEAEIAARDRKDLISTKLAAKGLSAEDVQKYSKYVDKLVDDEDEIDGAVDEVYNDFISVQQAQYGDPSAGFGGSKKPEQKGDDETGKSLYQQIRGK